MPSDIISDAQFANYFNIPGGDDWLDLMDTTEGWTYNFEEFENDLMVGNLFGKSDLFGKSGKQNKMWYSMGYNYQENNENWDAKFEGRTEDYPTWNEGRQMYFGKGYRDKNWLLIDTYHHMFSNINGINKELQDKITKYENILKNGKFVGFPEGSLD